MSDTRTTIGVWIPIDPNRPIAPPETRPMGRAALAMRARGLTVVFGDHFEDDSLVGMVAEPGGWRHTSMSVSALQDRFPSQSRSRQWAALHDRARSLGIPVGNGRTLTNLCRDKIRCQDVLESSPTLRLPPVEAQPSRFSTVLARWGGAFAKPRFGALGTGVRFVRPGETIPETLPGVVAGTADPTVLQWPVLPAGGYAGQVLRVLAQRVRRPQGGLRWHLLPAVLRQSRVDRVVNAARGAEVMAAEDALSTVVMDEVRAMVLQVCAQLEQVVDPGGLALELGIDLALDDGLRPWVLEVNSRPRGRLTVLARQDPARFQAEHHAAMIRPWLTLARAFGDR